VSQGELFDDLEAVADELVRRSATVGSSAGAPVPTSTLTRCAEFFAEHGQHAKAVGMLLHSQRLEEALSLAERHRVAISPSMADSLVLPKTPPEGVPEAEHLRRREHILLEAAKLFRKQEAFQLAAKMYTQAGDTVRAMKSLIKSGDTEKIMVFAGVSRSKEIYVLAANYLQVSRCTRVWLSSSMWPMQSLDWRTDAEIMKAIISFYTKAKAWEQLSGFYDACAQVEIDEFRNYDKAIGAMNEALRVANSIKDGTCVASLACAG
jgi:intraflagellar transport protein 140